jgi:6-phosphogluconolactonase (cycloisomerase 2 family)
MRKVGRGCSGWWLGLFGALLLIAGCGDSGSSPTPTLKISQYAYATNNGDDVVSEFKINNKTGALTLLGTTASAGVAGGARGLVVTPNQAFLYVANEANAEIYEFSINPKTGALTSLGDIVVNGGTAIPTRVAVDADGNILYVLDSMQKVWAYTIAANGTLALLVPPVGESNPVATGSGPQAIVANDANVYVVNAGDGTISVYNIDTDGTLTPAGTVDSLGTITGSPSDAVQVGDNFYSSDFAIGSDGGIAHFNIDANGGGLTFAESAAAGDTGEQFPEFITAAPDADMAFTSNIGVELGDAVRSAATIQQAQTSSSISIYSANPDTGVLTFKSAISFSGVPAAMTADQTSSFLYVPDVEDGSIAQYLIDAKNQTITPIGSGTVDTENPANPNSNPYMITTALFCNGKPCLR